MGKISKKVIVSENKNSTKNWTPQFQCIIALYILLIPHVSLKMASLALSAVLVS